METTLFLGMTMTELVGYLASAVVLISFLNKNLVRLRIINLVGCALFVAYGFVLPETSWPIVITNAAIILIHFYYLLRMTNTNPE